MKLGEYAITEAGFGADLGAEKFLDIKCRIGGMSPSAVVIVATVRALKYNGGAARNTLDKEDLAALKKGIPNLLKHIENVTVKFGLPAVVAVNRFPTDTEAELKLIEEKCRQLGVRAALSEVWAKGGEGGIELAEEVIRAAEEGKSGSLRFVYQNDISLREKMETVAREIYGADGVDFAPAALKDLNRLESFGLGSLPVCMAKTQYSLSDDPKKLGAPTGFRITVRSIRASAGAGFVVALTGDIMTMPGLPKVPAAEKIDIDSAGVISGLF